MRGKERFMKEKRMNGQRKIRENYINYKLNSKESKQ